MKAFPNLSPEGRDSDQCTGTGGALAPPYQVSVGSGICGREGGSWSMCVCIQWCSELMLHKG